MMTAMLKEIRLTTTGKEELIDITDRVRHALGGFSVRDGICTVFTPHTTAAVTINENADPDVVRDILHGLSRMVPEDGHRHKEGNSPAHIKSSLLGASEQVLLEGGALVLGSWQGIYFCEFDGPRQRRVFVKITPEETHNGRPKEKKGCAGKS